MNEQFNLTIKNILARGGELVATRRMPFLLEKIDFKNIKTIFDVGSWHLKQSIEFANIFPDANIYAFEPNPISANNCRITLSSLPFHLRNRTYVNEVALNNENKKIKFYPVDEKCAHPNLGASSKFKFIDGLDGSFVNQKWIQKEIEVDSITLDTWCNQNNVYPDLLWVDVQGAELDVLKGSINTLKNVKAIMTEVGIKPYYDGHTLKPEIDKFLLNNNFIELQEAFQMSHEFEADTIYINKSAL